MFILVAGQTEETDFVTILFAAIIMIMKRFMLAKVFMVMSMTMKMFSIDMLGQSILGEQDGEGKECMQ